MDKIEFKFEPLEEFSWFREHEDGSRQLIGAYHVGGTYNCSSDKRHDGLRVKCDEWLKAGKIKVFPLAPGARFKSERSAK